MAKKSKNGQPGEMVLRSKIIRQLMIARDISHVWAYNQLKRSGLKPVAEYGRQVVFYDKAKAEAWLAKEVRRGKAR